MIPAYDAQCKVESRSVFICPYMYLQDFRFVELRKISFGDSGVENCNDQRFSLLCTSNHFGLTFVGCKTGGQIYVHVLHNFFSLRYKGIGIERLEDHFTLVLHRGLENCLLFAYFCRVHVIESCVSSRHHLAIYDTPIL